MNSFKYFFSALILCMLFSYGANAQGVVDPQALPVYQTTTPITIDGSLKEAVWNYNLPFLRFRLNGTPSGNANTPTGYTIVKPPYTDTSTCDVRFIHDGNKLYISLKSDDKQVCSFGNGSWEGDGIFLTIADAKGTTHEYKLYYNFTAPDTVIHYEEPYKNWGAGAGKKAFGTTANDSSNVDNGYTAELMINLDSLGYGANVDSIKLRFTIFDPDNFSAGVSSWGTNGSFAKQWWGSEWGPDMRTLVLTNTLASQTPVDPMTLPVYQSATPLTVDGSLDEAGWKADVPRLQFRVNGTPSGNIYTPTNYAIVKPPYTDTSTCEVRFLHDGMKLYVSLNSDDKQVCSFGNGSWEGDGIFLTIADAKGATHEFKLYYNFYAKDTVIHYDTQTPTWGAGAGKKGSQTTVNDSSNVDNGYTAELMIDLDSLGYTADNDSINLRFTIFDPDNFSANVSTWDANGNFAKQWWGSEWGPDMRTLVLVKGYATPPNSDPMALKVYQTATPIKVDGSLDEAGWKAELPRMQFRINGTGSGNVYTPTNYAIVKPPYTDTSTCEVRFLHDGMKLYVSLNSDDKQVCSFGNGSWEGDGIFLTIADAQGATHEYKLYYNFTARDTIIHYEAPYRGWGAGAGAKGSNTVVNDSSNVDNGYTAELLINLDSLGYTAKNDSVKLRFTIFDPDNFSANVSSWGANGNFAKQWWGSEWGPDMRTLVLSSDYATPPNADPLAIPVYQTDKAVTVDGNLNEAGWKADVPRLKFRINGTGSGNVYTPTNYAIVKGPYTDTSTCEVRFMHDGLKLYVALNSDDKQVCSFGNGSWEGDGIFLTIADAQGATHEFKLYYNFTALDTIIHYEAPYRGWGAGAGVKGSSTVVNDSSNVDNGYTAELLINLDSLGYTAKSDSIKLRFTIFDPDNFSANVSSWGANGNFAKQWWGSEWGPDMRTLVLKSSSVTGVKGSALTAAKKFALYQNYPNPFNPSTQISFDLPENSNITLNVYNILGQLVKVIAKGEMTSGSHVINFNASEFASGVYIYSLHAKGASGHENVATHKMMLMK